jgi:hypothetical protein
MPKRRGVLLGAIALAVAAALTAGVARSTRSATACALKGPYKHVIYVQFDNTHYLRDNKNVPSDLEQMPALLNFIKGNGSLLTNDHTVLISHTAGGILSTLTGVYPDRHGQIVSNSNVRFTDTGGFSFPSSFGYWTDPIVATTTVPNMVTPTGKNAPAPWVPYTKGGCDFGAVATANTVLENTGTGASGDITKVFGAGTPQFTEAQQSAAAPAGSAARAKAQTDFVGFAIHCAAGSATCANGHPDALPDEPGGYDGYKGLFGAQEINPFLTGGPTMTDLLGGKIQDPFGQDGFPGFDGMYAATSLAYVAQMQEKGVPVTFAYISDAHDNHGVAGNAHTAYGPGSPGYVAQLKAYNDAFAAFFARLTKDGITKANTLFVFAVDEGDHFAGVQKTGCDGVKTPCNYGTNEVGEVNANIDTLLNDQHPELFAKNASGAPIFNFTVHGDDAPTFYLTGNPDPGSTPVRDFERAAAGLTALNPYTNATDKLMKAMASRTEMRALHMFTTGDPLRNPTFAYFADPNYFLTDFPTSTCKTCINPDFAWNHGDIQPEIATTWLGLVGPGVQKTGVTAKTWSDHTDVQPTMLELLGLKSSYQSDGRVLSESLSPSALPKSLTAHSGTLTALGQAYKQLNAPFGAFGMATLAASTKAIVSGSATSDATYQQAESALGSLTDQRDTLAATIRSALDGAEFHGKAITEKKAKAWIAAANKLIATAKTL